jgi:hypothetical protein
MMSCFCSVLFCSSAEVLCLSVVVFCFIGVSEKIYKRKEEGKEPKGAFPTKK